MQTSKLSKWPKVKDGLLSLAAGVLVGASSASLSSRAADQCIERSDTIGRTVVHQTQIKGTMGCTIEVKLKDAQAWAHRFNPEGKHLVRFEGLDGEGRILIQKADGALVRIRADRAELISERI